MRPIVTITLNPALDVSTAADSVVPGPKLRCDAPRLDPGGGGVNVSRAVRILGGDSLALVALGGATGAQIEMLLAGEGITLERIEAPGDTRHSLAVTDRATGGQYRFVLPGPTWDDADVDRALDHVAAAVPKAAIAVLSGSQPPGTPADLPARLAHRLTASGADLLVDTSGPVLAALLAEPPGLGVLRLDGAEAEALAGTALPGLAETAALARDLVARGVARMVVLARGAEGNVLADATGAWAACAPQGRVASAVGAGDSFVGAFVLSLARGEAPPEALRHGTAAAAAAVLTDATELCRRSDVDALLPGTTLDPL